MLEKLKARYENAKNLTWDNERDNIYSMKKADIMISDFSGIIYDYTFLCDKPVMYANAELNLEPYDAFDINKTIWQFETINKIGIKLEEKDFANLKNVILNASDNPELSELRKKAKNEAWQHIGEAGKLTVDYMVSTVEKLSN